jgi:HEAT repeat protein
MMKLSVPDKCPGCCPVNSPIVVSVGRIECRRTEVASLFVCLLVFATTAFGQADRVNRLIHELNGQDRAVRLRAAEALGWTKSPRAVEPLIEALHDPDPAVRFTAASSLGTLKDRRAVAPLIAALQDRASSVRHEAIQALGGIGDPRAVDPLITVLNDRNSDDRREAALSLGLIKDSRAVEPLMSAISDPAVASDAGRALQSINPPGLLDRLVTDLKRPDPAVQMGAARALEPMKAFRAVGPLVDALQDVDPGVVFCSARALGAIALLGPPSGIRPAKPPPAGVSSAARALRSAWSRGDLRVIAAAASFFAYEHQFNPHGRALLVEALNTCGDDHTANSLLQPGVPELTAAVRAWAKTHHRQVMSLTIDSRK